MTRPNRQISNPVVEDLPMPPVPEQPLEERIAEHEHRVDNVDREAIDNILLNEDVQKGGKIRLERKGPLDSQYNWLKTIPAEEWVKAGTDGMLEWIRNLFGGGNYRCMTHRANGKTYRQFEFAIDPRFSGKLDEDQIRNLKGGNGQFGPSVIMPPADNFKTSDMLKFMEMGNNKSEQMMTLLMTMMMKSQETMSTIMASMINAMGQATRSQAPTESPLLLELIKQKTDRPPMMEVIEMMQALKSLNEPSEPEKEETMFDKIIKAAGLVMPALQGVIPQAVQPQQLQQPQGVLLSLPKEMQLGINQLLRAARRGADPALYADLIIDQTSDNPQHLTILKQILTDPAWKAKLFGDERAVADIAIWLEDLKNLIISYDPANPNPEQTNGDPGAPAGDSASGVGGPASDSKLPGSS